MNDMVANMDKSEKKKRSGSGIQLIEHYSKLIQQRDLFSKAIHQ